MGNDTQDQRPHGQVGFGIAVVVLLLVAGLNVLALRRDAALQAAIQSRFAMHDGQTTRPFLDLTPGGDPGIGSPLPSTGLGDRIRRAGRAPRGTVLIALSDCSACTRFDWRRWAEDGRRLGFAVVAISGSSPREVDEYARGKGPGMSVFRDPGLELHRALNAGWNGRMYYFGSDWRLRWAMADAEGGSHLAGLPALRALIEAQGPTVPR